MSNFDYISAKEFRESLEADYTELKNCVEAQAWKSVQVLAGSIVESLLIDYLASTPSSTRPKKDPLKFDLAEAITICRDEQVLSDRTADLCSVIKSYRNLIHPGRMIRLGEQAPNKGSATIALALIEMITDDLAKILRASVGLTAEQILSKIQRDANSLNILQHLLAEVSESQRERLLIEHIPLAYSKAITSATPNLFFEDAFAKEAKLLESAYRITLETMPPESRKRIALEFVRILREEDGKSVLNYGKAFFRASDLKFLSKPNISMVCEHLIGNSPGSHNAESIKNLGGISKYLEPSQVLKWIDPIMRTLVSSSIKENIKEDVRDYLIAEATNTTASLVDKAISKRLEEWIKHFKDNGEKDSEAIVQRLKKDIDDLQIPF